MLALIVFIFGICWLPYRGLVMYNSFVSKKWDPDWLVMFLVNKIFFSKYKKKN